jgi:hypothetical protein
VSVRAALIFTPSGGKTRSAACRHSAVEAPKKQVNDCGILQNL